ncbi:uncharacterized protein LOC129952637 [Eupeodes corollae]|uniref:uncharacterized protein LOC129952637 n=1 Tax=Eupeodes corollae TaxID=290404 RepID=UPI002492B4F8|nr:uncharacterized protein LOC129952637 [Eupeodes corollae]
MILLKVSVLILTCLVGKASTEILHCYECEDCRTINDTHLRACPEVISTTASDNLLPDTTTASPLPSTTSKLSTILLTTTKPETELADTTIPIVELDESTLPPPDSIAPEEEDTNSAAVPPDEINEEDTEKVKRSIRQVSYKTLMIRRSAIETQVYHHCYSIMGFGPDMKRNKKGCVEVIGTKKGCEILGEQYNFPIANCKVCGESKCNNSSVLGIYLILYPIFVTLIVYFI